MSKRFIALLAVLLCTGATSLVAAPPQKVDASTPEALTSEPTYIAERAIKFDEKTGAFRKPTREETSELVRTLKAMTNRSFASLKVTTTADGMQKADLNDGFSQVILARPIDEGGIETLCVSTFEEAVEFLGLRLESPQGQPKREGAAK